MSRRPSPSMVVALIALAVALSGVAYAAIKIPANSVKSRHIVNGQVKSPDIRDNSVTGLDVNEASLQGVSDPRVLTSGYVQVDDPGGGGSTSAILVVADDFTINGVCDSAAMNPAVGTITIDSSQVYSVVSTERSGGGVSLGSTTGANNLLAVNNVEGIDGGEFEAMTQFGPSAIHGLMHATSPGPNSCRFSVSAITNQPQLPD